jgi:hypothetical protein
MGRDVAEKKQAAQKGSRDRSAEHPMAKLWAFRPPGKGPTTAELEVASDVISRAKAADSSLRNADERLVCAALALRAGEFGGVPTRAAEAMGKVGSKAKHVRDWVARIEKLEQASGSTSTVNSSELLVHRQWIEKETPGIHQLEVEPLLLSVGKRHGKRKLTAQTTTPGGTASEVSATVDYTLPPAEGERASGAKRRVDRHRQREEKKLRSLDYVGVAPLDDPPFGLSPELLVSPEWITNNTPSLVQGSFRAGELERVDLREEARSSLCDEQLSDGQRAVHEETIRLINEGKAPAFSARRRLYGELKPECLELACAYCEQPVQLMDRDGNTADVEAVVQAWRELKPGSARPPPPPPWLQGS